MSHFSLCGFIPVQPLELCIKTSVPPPAIHRDSINYFTKAIRIARLCQLDWNNRVRNNSKNTYNKKARDRFFQLGRKVFLYVPTTPRGQSSKLQFYQKGPYQIIGVHANGHAYKLLDLNTFKPLPHIHNVKNLIPAFLPNENKTRQFLQNHSLSQNDLENLQTIKTEPSGTSHPTAHKTPKDL